MMPFTFKVKLFKTKQQKYEENQAYLKEMSCKRVKHFCLLPRQLLSGEWVWLKWVYKELFICRKMSSGTYYASKDGFGRYIHLYFRTKGKM